ncbi:hypothetical protein FFF34_000265 [Inquilinus sp. KBS0705]|nr:hypothetical protein FFF34_000265 [Inquilinus sp. KBS0705]
MSIGKLVYKYIFEPTAGIRYKFHHYGLKGWLDYELGVTAMKKAAIQLPAITLKPSVDCLTINYLTGQQYWYQTIFGIQSLINQYGTDLAINIYSDGSLQAEHYEALKNYCPQIVFVAEEEIIESLNAIIPANKYPKLNFLRNWSPFYKRMIDIHCKPQWGIHLDSDMLFLKYPTDLVELSKQKKAFYMEEYAGQSFFSDEPDSLLKNLNIPVIQSVNGGIIAYNGNTIDYDDLEYRTTQLLDTYFDKGPGPMEQTLMSYILATQNGIALNKNDYKIYYDNSINQQDDATLRHYIFKAKLPYFSDEWKKVIL